MCVSRSQLVFVGKIQNMAAVRAPSGNLPSVPGKKGEEGEGSRIHSITLFMSA